MLIFLAHILAFLVETSITVHIKKPLFYFIFFHAKCSNACTAPGLFTVSHQCEPTTPLFSLIGCTIRAAREALICGHENMVNNIIAALSCALMLTGKKKRGGPRREAGGVQRTHQ